MKKKKNKTPDIVHLLKILLFVILMLVFAFIGLLFPLRPKESEVEKRKLAEFPKLTWNEFWSGDFFSGVSTWYADTFPFREKLIDDSFKIEGMYGVKSEQIIGTVVKSDDFDDDGTDSTTADTASDASDNAESDVPAVTETEAPATEDEEDDGEIPDNGEQVNGVYVVGDTIYELSFYNKAVSARYAAAVSKVAEKTKGYSTVYNLIVPKAYGYYLSESQKKSLGVPEEDQTINAIFSQMSSGVKTVDVYSALKSKKKEYIFFRTDHHWTALGAYYAYECFCTARGTEYKELSWFTEASYPDFLGTLYSDANKPSAAAANPDTVYTYTPKSTNIMSIYDQNWKTNGGPYKWDIVKDVSDYGQSTKYLAFIGGDNAFSEIENPDLDDGSSILVIKDSFGNAMIPFLVDDYQHIYIMDFRYFKRDYSSLSIPDFAKENNIKDILFLNNITMANSKNLVEYVEALAG